MHHYPAALGRERTHGWMDCSINLYSFVRSSVCAFTLHPAAKLLQHLLRRRMRLPMGRHVLGETKPRKTKAGQEVADFWHCSRSSRRGMHSIPEEWKMLLLRHLRQQPLPERRTVLHPGEEVVPKQRLSRLPSKTHLLHLVSSLL